MDNLLLVPWRGHTVQTIQSYGGLHEGVWLTDPSAGSAEARNRDGIVQEISVGEPHV